MLWLNKVAEMMLICWIRIYVLFLISFRIQLLIIQKKVSLVFYFLFIFMLHIFQGQADPLVSEFKLPHEAPALAFKRLLEFTVYCESRQRFLYIRQELFRYVPFRYSKGCQFI